MKLKRKPKIHPASYRDPISVLNLLPTTIISLSSPLSLPDREVLAYMIIHSITTTHHHSKKSPPLFQCNCFECYTAYWLRWDSSPNRELIHQAIEAFEDHFSSPEGFTKFGGGGGGGRVEDKDEKVEVGLEFPVAAPEESGGLEGVGGEEGAAAVVEVRFPASNQRGLARKVLPDLVGLFNSRLWSFWSPNV